MAELLTRADSLRIFLTGAGSDGGAQTDPNAALGNYRSASEVVGLSPTITSAIANISIDYVAGANGVGSGSLTASASDDLRWTPPGGTQGPAVTIMNGESKLLEGGSTPGPNQYIRVTRSSATALTGTATVVLADPYNNTFDNVGSAEAVAGDSEYRGFMLKNGNAVSVGSVKIWLATLGTQQTSDSAELGSSGAGTITTTGSFADWPATGFVRITQSGGTLREICYYSSRTSTTLTVPSTGRALLGTTAAAGAGTDLVDAVPGLRLAKEATSSSHIQTIASEGTAPTGLTWATGIIAADGLNVGDLAPGAMYGLWIHRLVPVGEISAASVLNSLRYSFDAA